MIDHNTLGYVGTGNRNKLEVARELVQQYSGKIVMFTGAGISAESGISTFRDKETGALWEKYDPALLSSMDGFMENPTLVWGWYKSRLLAALSAAPNGGHYALTYQDSPVITQNVDLLHEKAGSSEVLHMHGRGDQARCTVCSWKGAIHELVNINEEDVLPTCPDCQALGRPDVVWFGEELDYDLCSAATSLLRGKLCVVVGTSAQVYPMAGYPYFADRIISINTRDEDHFSTAIGLTGKASEVLYDLFTS